MHHAAGRFRIGVLRHHGVPSPQSHGEAVGRTEETAAVNRHTGGDELTPVKLRLVPERIIFRGDDAGGGLALQHLRLRHGGAHQRVVPLPGGNVAGVEHHGDLGRNGHGVGQLVEGAGLQVQGRVVQHLEPEAEGRVLQHAAQARHRRQVAPGGVAADGHFVCVQAEFLRPVIEPAHCVESVVGSGGPGELGRLAVVDADHADVQLVPQQGAPEVRVLAVSRHEAAAVHVEIDRGGLFLRRVEDDPHLPRPGRHLHALPRHRERQGIRLVFGARQHGLAHHEIEVHQLLPVHFAHVFFVHEIRELDLIQGFLTSLFLFLWDYDTIFYR